MLLLSTKQLTIGNGVVKVYSIDGGKLLLVVPEMFGFSNSDYVTK